MQTLPQNAPKFHLNTAYTLYLTLGVFSAHRFYLKKNVSAIFQLLGGFGFIIFVCFLVAYALISNDSALEILRSIRPSLEFDDQDTLRARENLIKPIMVFALPNLAYLAWIIYDFFNLEKMVDSANLSAGCEIENLSENPSENPSQSLNLEEKSANLASARQLAYIGCGLLILMAVLNIFGTKINGAELASTAGQICLAMSAYFIASTICSKTLLRNLTLFVVFDGLALIPFLMMMFGDKSLVVFVFGAVFTGFGACFALLIYKELFQTSGCEIFVKAFFVYALSCVIGLVLVYFNPILAIIAVQICSIINSLFIIACAKDSRNFEISKNNYYFTNLKFHISEFNKIKS
ncbi:TM2 domain-containing protein [Campylobacter sp. JMF_08 NE1]|uniref:TM2 domain-containing protein n=1 Tax=Campylobacter sp. JMF_08 NE1 TaxID=2983821 RepID=UPI0022EA01C1|nr:TM2 domain-containing protein [Campylobacter sp. JMF_08 NE1]MDA3047987.1 TM2 domain-containing protein [Campylobacter sp. JMF_08 NE1]